MKARHLISLLPVLFALTATAQTTVVRGRVTDADTGAPIESAAILFKGTSIGTMTGRDGRYSLETSDSTACSLFCYILGYSPQDMDIVPGMTTRADFSLKVYENRLSGSRVKADNRKARQLLANIDARRDSNNPEMLPSYACDIYAKTEIDLANAGERLRGRKMLKQWDFVFDYADTSSVPGKSCLPTVISESVIFRRHTLTPPADVEDIKANRVSGVNPENNLISQFTGSMHLKANFYEPFINAFGAEFPSPLQRGGLLYYNYYIVDSLLVDGRKTYDVHYHPKKGISTPAFDGSMLIDAGDYALRRIHAKMKRGANVNWLKDLKLDAEYRRTSDSIWFYRQNDLYVNLAVVPSDSSKSVSLLGIRRMTYEEPDFSPQEAIDLSGGIVRVEREAGMKDDEYWKSNRPSALSSREEGIYEMVDSIQTTPLYNTVYTVVETIVNGYYDFGPIGFGPVLKTVSANNLEGFRPRIGLHTSSDLSTKRRVSGYLAYGCRDRQFKGGLTYERMFSREPTRKLTVDAHYDVMQFGRVEGGVFSMDNVLNSLWYGEQKLCPMTNYSVLYEHEVTSSVNLSASAALKRWYGNEYVPLVAQDGTVLKSFAANELHLKARFSKDETVNRGYFVKKYVHSLYPVLTVDLGGSVAGLREGDWSYFRPEVTLDWVLRVPSAGKSKIRLTGGTVVGQVPYPLLNMFSGNATNFVNRYSFACMDYMEFAADNWATLMWEHNFYGFFLGKIPLLSKLHLREELAFRMAYGTVSEKNCGPSAPLRFPEYLSVMGNTPYMEVGAGITNIFRLLRVNCYWRLTHRDTALHNFKVMFGIDLSF